MNENGQMTGSCTAKKTLRGLRWFLLILAAGVPISFYLRYSEADPLKYTPLIWAVFALILGVVLLIQTAVYLRPPRAGRYLPLYTVLTAALLIPLLWFFYVAALMASGRVRDSLGYYWYFLTVAQYGSFLLLPVAAAELGILIGWIVQRTGGGEKADPGVRSEKEEKAAAGWLKAARIVCLCLWPVMFFISLKDLLTGEMIAMKWIVIAAAFTAGALLQGGFSLVFKNEREPVPADAAAILFLTWPYIAAAVYPELTFVGLCAASGLWPLSLLAGCETARLLFLPIEEARNNGKASSEGIR